MELDTLKDLYIHELKDLFSAEQQLVKALPKMAKAASNKELATGFQQHLEQTKEHAQRLQQILSSHKQTTRGPKCKGMQGIVAEGAEMIEEEADIEVKDAGLIAAAQRVEHYEMAGYGTARAYAELVGDSGGPIQKRGAGSTRTEVAYVPDDDDRRDLGCHNRGAGHSLDLSQHTQHARR